MKLAFGLFLAFVVAVSAQDPTVTDGLLAAQADLSLGHEFFETLIVLNRGQVSAYLYRINKEIISSHIDTYSFLNILGSATEAEFDELEVNEQSEDCLNNIRNRWDLQIARYGHRLATCVNNAYTLLEGWNSFLNDLHALGQVTGNQVQNLGLSILSNTAIFDGRNSLPDLINREFRMLLTRARPYRDGFDDFLESISTEVIETIEELINCDKVLEAEFEREVAADLARGRGCVGLPPSETESPIPT